MNPIAMSLTSNHSLANHSLTNHALDKSVIDSPLVKLICVATQDALVGVFQVESKASAFIDVSVSDSNRILKLTKKQLCLYFEGKIQDFTIPLAITGTPFRAQVWKALLQIPYGETRSYKDIAESIGNPKASRAVGMANHHNPISVIIPCHRVVGKNKSLTGYAGGLENKKMLLNLESPNSFR